MSGVPYFLERVFNCTSIPQRIFRADFDLFRNNNDTLEVIQRIPLDKLRPYPDHPFGVRDDDMMQQTVESIKQFGVLVPGIARPLPDGTYVIQQISHRIVGQGLPTGMTEDLRSRITAEEAESIHRWKNSSLGKPFVVIVRKIPFTSFQRLHSKSG